MGRFPPLQLIFMEECVEAEGRRWHPEHFCCVKCGQPFGEEGGWPPRPLPVSPCPLLSS